MERVAWATLMDSGAATHGLGTIAAAHVALHTGYDLVRMRLLSGLAEQACSSNS